MNDIGKIVGQARELAAKADMDVWRLCYGCLDVTALGVADTEGTVRELVEKVLARDEKPAAVCVWPNFVDTAGLVLGDSRVRIASVAGGFPTGQTYLEVKMLEAAMAVENGADEIDMVMNIGRFLEGDEGVVAGEIETLRAEIGEDVTLKVIVEAGMLPSLDDVRRASAVVMDAGADFVKTSTGKAMPATPEAAAAMCLAIRDHAARTGRRVGFKAAGGIRTREDAALYQAIVRTALGEEWLTPSLFRIGASALADDLLAAIKR